MQEYELNLIKQLVDQLEADVLGYDKEGQYDDYTDAERELAIADTKAQIVAVLSR